MAGIQKVVKFFLDEQPFALSIGNIVQIIRAVEITSIPNAPQNMLGVINYHGSIIPVMNIRQSLGLQHKELEPNQRFIIASTTTRTIALVVDSVSDIVNVSEANSIDAQSIVEHSELKKMVRLDAGILFIYDIEKLLKASDHKLLEHTMAEFIHQDRKE